MAENVWARSYLKNLGYTDDDIGYDSDNKALTLKGKSILYGVTPNAEGKAVVDSGALDQAVNRTKQNNYMQQYEANLAKPVQSFTYDVNSIKQDPMYTSALASFTNDQNNQTDKTLVRLGSRGIGNSSSAQLAENAGANNITNYANTKLAPQVIAQKYQQWLDTNAAQEKQNQGLLSLANAYNGFNQQALENERQAAAAAQQTKQSNWNAYLQSVGLTGDLGTGPKSDFSLLGDRTGNLTMAGQQYKDSYDQQQYTNKQNEKQQAFENGMKSELQKANLSNMSADNARQWASLAQSKGDSQTSNLFKIWEATGQAPSGLEGYGVQAGTPLAGKNSSVSTKIDAKDSADNYDTIIGDLGMDGVTKEQAKQLAQANRSYLTDSDYKKLLDEINKRF